MSEEDICSTSSEINIKLNDKKRPANSPLNDNMDGCTDFYHIRETTFNTVDNSLERGLNKQVQYRKKKRAKVNRSNTSMTSPLTQYKGMSFSQPGSMSPYSMSQPAIQRHLDSPLCRRCPPLFGRQRF
jgi:hypothetical protein